MALFVQYFIPCKQLYMFRVKHVELFAGNCWNIFKNLLTMHGHMSIKFIFKNLLRMHGQMSIKFIDDARTYEYKIYLLLDNDTAC
jgi:hypothetical protein